MTAPAACAAAPTTSSILALVEDVDRAAALHFVQHAKRGRWRTIRRRALIKQYGLSEASARRIEAAMHLARELMFAHRPAALHSAADVAALIAPLIVGDELEAVWIIGVDAGGHPIETTCVALGTSNSVAVLPRDVFSVLLRVGATAGFLVHTHPGGEPHASNADLLALRQLVAVGDLIGIPISDMVVVAPNGYCSALEQWMERAEFDELAAASP